MDLNTLLSHGASGLVGFCLLIIWNLVKNKGKAGSSPYRQDFLEKLGEMLQRHTHEIQQVSAHLAEQGKVVLAVDPVTNFPRLWNDSPQQKRTHDAVTNLLEMQEEIAKSVSEIQRKIA